MIRGNRLVCDCNPEMRHAAVCKQSQCILKLTWLTGMNRTFYWKKGNLSQLHIKGDHSFRIGRELKPSSHHTCHRVLYLVLYINMKAMNTIHV